MAGSQDNSKRPLRLFSSIGIEILIFAVLSILTALALRPVQERMRLGMEELRDMLLNRGEEFIGRKIEYASIGPSIFGTLDIRNIRIRRDDGSPVVSVSRLRISYSLWHLIREGAAASLRSIRIDRPLLSFSLDRDGDLRDRFTRSFERSPETAIRRAAAILPENVRLSVRSGAGDLKNEGFLIRAEGISFDASVSGGRIAFQGKWTASASLGGLFAGLAEARMSGRLSGECSADLSSGSADLDLPFLQGDLFRLRPLTVKFTLGKNMLEIRKINDRTPFDISMDYDFNSRELTGSFRCENFFLRDILVLHGFWQPYDSWLAARVSGRLSLEKKEEGIFLSADISGAGDAGSPAEGISFALKGRGGRDRVDFDRLEFNFPGGRLGFSGYTGLRPFAPVGYISVADLSFSGEESFSAGFRVSTRGGEIGLFAENAAAGSVPLPVLDLLVIPDDRGLSFEISAQPDISSGESSPGRLSLEGSFDYGPRELRASFLLESLSLRNLLDAARPFTVIPLVPAPFPAVAEELLASAEVYFSTDFKQIIYNAPRIQLSYRGGDVYALSSFSGTNRHFDLMDTRINWRGGGLELSGSADFANPREVSFSLKSSYMDHLYELGGVVLGRNSLSIWGSYGLQIYLGATGPAAYSGYVAAQEIPLPYRGGVARLSFFCSLNWDPGRFWSVDISHFELADLVTPVASLAVLRFSGEANQNGIVLEDLFFDDGKGILRGALAFGRRAGAFGFGGTASLSNPARLERYDFEVSYGAESSGSPLLSFRLGGAQMQLARVVRNSRNALVSGELRASWDPGEELPWDSLTAELRIDSLSAQLQDRELRLSTGASLNRGEFSLHEFRAGYGGIEAYMPLFRLNRRESRALAGARIWGDAGGRELDLNFSVEADLGTAESWLRPDQLFTPLRGSLTVADFRYGDLRAGDPFSFYFFRDRELISLSGGPEDMFRFRISGDGDFYAGLSTPSPVRGSVIGVIARQTIEAQAQDLYVDISSLWNLIPPQREFGIAGGYVTASLRVSGPLRDPEFFGVLRGSSLRLQVPNYLAEDIRPIPVLVNLEGNEAAFGPVPAAVGSGSGLVSGWFRFDRWIPNIFSIDIQVPPETPIPVAFDVQGLVARGYSSGNLRLDMADLILSVSGDLIAQETEITLNTEELSSHSGRAFSPQMVSVALNLGIRAGRKVEFLWPNARMPILQAYAEMGTGLRIISNSASRRYSLEGDVGLRGGEILYAERSFYIREGSLVFRENEIRFEPRISARAEIRDRTDSGPVTISMIIDNAPLRSFTARLESNPPLSQVEIFSLLGQSLTGAPSAEEDGRVKSPFMASGLDLFMQFTWIRFLEQQVRDFLWLDMFSVRTQLLQNATLQLFNIQDPVDRIDGVGNYFDNTTVFLGKYFGPDVFTQFMISMRYDKMKTSFGGLTLEPDIGIELHSPLVDIRWNFIPLHPENMYINDQSFTLMWRRSF